MRPAKVDTNAQEQISGRPASALAHRVEMEWRSRKYGAVELLVIVTAAKWIAQIETDEGSLMKSA